ncbi:MAG: restriction endonuclease [Defluviitaleaceae bacterium]|nr:restriction endonuclease [Defluviitaleaceae bacterium]
MTQAIAGGIIFAIIMIIIARANRKKSYKYNAAAINEMDGHDFEEYCARLLEINGFRNVRTTQKSGDRGIDILCEKNGETYAIQCKRHSGKISRKAVQEAYTGMAIYQCDIGAILTNSDFAQSAINDANDLGIKLWNGTHLRNMHTVK